MHLYTPFLRARPRIKPYYLFMPARSTPTYPLAVRPFLSLHQIISLSIPQRGGTADQMRIVAAGTSALVSATKGLYSSLVFILIYYPSHLP